MQLHFFTETGDATEVAKLLPYPEPVNVGPEEVYENTHVYDNIMARLEKLNEMGEAMNTLLTDMILELNPDCTTMEEVNEKLNPPKEPKAPVVKEDKPLTDTAMAVLQACTVEDKVVKLPAGQLDRKDYEAVKNKLELIGGKWKGGKVAGFVFLEDPTELLQQIANGESRNLKKEFQFFGTPSRLANLMVKHALGGYDATKMKICEPSAGQGAIVEAINTYTHGTATVYCYEAMPVNKTILLKVPNVHFLGDDFLQHTGMDFDVIIANPPFSKGQDIQHIMKMWDCLVPGGRLVTLASPGWQYGSQKKQVAFREFLKSNKAEVSEVPAGTFKESGTNITTVMIIIDKPS